MSEALAEISRVTGLGMIAVRADLARSGAALAAAVGPALPGQTRFTAAGDRMIGWMSPDELLVILPAAEVAAVVAALQDALGGDHGLIVDVSDMRAVFDITGAGAGDVIAKLSPTDLARLPADGLRRSRAAQVPVAFWRQGDGFRLIGFRSVADYLQTVLGNAAAPGSGLAPR